MAAQPNPREAGERIEYLLGELSAADPAIYAMVEDVLGLVTDLYGAGLARVLEISGRTSPATIDALASDELVGSLLVVHDLHPYGLVERVESALEKVRPLLARHGGDVELVRVDPCAPAVSIRLIGSCDGCPSSAITLESAVQRAILEAAPEVERLEVEGSATNGIEVAVQIGSKPPLRSGTQPAPGPCPADLVETG